MWSYQTLAYLSRATMDPPCTSFSQTQRTEISTRTRALGDSCRGGALCPKSNVLLVWRQLNKSHLLDPSKKPTRLRTFTVVHTCPMKRNTEPRQKGLLEQMAR